MRKPRIFVLLALLAVGSPLQAQTNDAVSTIGIGDILSISVSQRPDLNRELTVAANGAITYPLVGEVFVNGLSPEEAGQQILQAIRDVYPSVSDLEVTVTPAGKFGIYVAGAVGRPGKYSFSETPNLWDAIREAGGPTGDAALDAVRIVGDPKTDGRSKVVDVQRALDSGKIGDLPDLEDGDSIVIPLLPEGVGNRSGGIYGVDVYGSVANPGTYRMPESSTMVEALLMAGGTLPDAKMAKVALVRPTEGGKTETITVDLRDFLADGDTSANPVVRPGDTVYVPRQNSFWWSLKNNAGVVVGLIGSMVTLAVIVANNN